MPMPPSVLPLLREPDYPRFQQMIPELQTVSYAEWQGDHQKAALYRRSRNGSKDVPVSPDAFADWLKATRQAAHLELLWTYAEDVAPAA
jgi:hypothetical protein